jgi:small GTP-binding protein
MEDDEYDLIFKLLLVGDSGVGKTNITTRFAKDQFDLESKATIGVEYASKKVKIDGMNIKAQIWDTAGQERYQSITRAYYRGSKGAFIVFDITKKQSFYNIDNWFAELKKSADQNITIILLGNKSDLDEERQVTTEEGLMKAKEYGKNILKSGIPYMETSAKTSVNIDKAFLRLVEGKKRLMNRDIRKVP